MKNTIKNNVIIAVVKGFAHATIIPMVLMIVTNIAFSGNWGIVVAISYLFFVAIVYMTTENKDISKRIFFSTLSAISIVLLFIVFTILAFIAWI